MYIDAQGQVHTTTLPDSAFTDGSGKFTVVDNTSPGQSCTGYQLNPAGMIQLDAIAKSSSLRGNDPADTCYAYRVLDASANVFDYKWSTPVDWGSGSSATADAIIPDGTTENPNPVHDAFEVLTVLYTYISAARQIGLGVTDPVNVIFVQGQARSEYQSGIKQIQLKMTDVDLDAKVIGHEYGHYAADEVGALNPVGETHYLLENQRLLPTPGDLTLEAQWNAFNEGLADWFAVSGAANSPTSGCLASLPGFGAQINTLDGRPLNMPAGAGEDEELSVGRIMAALETDPACGSERAVFTAATTCGGTLYGLWQKITTGANAATQDRLAGIFGDDRAAPTLQPAKTTVNTAGATFDFYLPVVCTGIGSA